MRHFFVLSLGLVCDSFKASIGDPSSDYSKWFPEVPTPVLPLSPDCPSEISSGYFGGSNFARDGGVMAEFRITSAHTGSLTYYSRKAGKIVLIIAMDLEYRLRVQVGMLDHNTPGCVLEVNENLLAPGHRTVLTADTEQVSVSRVFHQLTHELLNEPVYWGYFPLGVVMSPDLIFGVPTLRRIPGDVSTMDWQSFMHKEVKTIGLQGVPISVSTLIAHTHWNSSTKSGNSPMSMGFSGVIVMFLLSLMLGTI